MSYPQPSDFASAVPLSAWFLHANADGTTSVCSSTGAGLLYDLQYRLQDRLTTTPLPTFDGTLLDGTAVPSPDPLNPPGGWDAATLRALWAVANDANAPAQYLSAVHGDAQLGAGPVSAATLQTGLWVGEGYYEGVVAGTGASRYGVGSPDEVRVPAGAALPAIDAAPQAPSNATSTSGAVCNAVPANVAATIPVVQTVVPFQFNAWIVFAVVVVGVGAIVWLARDVPAVDPTLRAEQTARRNPRAARSTQRSRR